MNAPERSESERTALLEYLRWNSYLSERHRLLYVATPKVACTSFKWWFAALEGCADAIRAVPDSVESDPEMVIHDTFHTVAPQVTGLAPDRIEGVLDSPLYYRFALVRNPFTRIFSAWQSKLLLREPVQSVPYLECDFFHWRVENESDLARAFEAFLDHLATCEAPRFRDAHWAPQHQLLRPDLIAYSRISKIEEHSALGEELEVRLGPGVPSPFKARRRNESLIPYLPQWVTPRSAELIRELYAADFDAFGYSPEPPSAKGNFSSAQLGVALDAIDLLRRRHQRLRDSRAALRGRIDVLEQAVKALEARIHELGHELVTRDAEGAARDTTIALLRQDIQARDSQIDELERQVNIIEPQRNALRAELDAILASHSWRLIGAMRWLRRNLFTRPGAALTGALRARTNRLRLVRVKSEPKARDLDPVLLYGPAPESRTDSDFTSICRGPAPQSLPARLICFYGSNAQGVDWSRVRSAPSRFDGHEQPCEPGELGCYELPDPRALRRQVELAQLYGIGGFCFRLDWVGGPQLSEAIPASYLAAPDLALSFCLCWCNAAESDRPQSTTPGEHAPVHAERDDLAFIQHIERYLRDPRYIRIGGKPLVLVGHPERLHSAADTTRRWRQWCRSSGVGELYLACAQSPDLGAPARLGFDAAFESAPDERAAPDVTREVDPLSIRAGGRVLDWRALVAVSQHYDRPGHPLFRAVCPGWDDSPRLGRRGVVFVRNKPALFRRWLQNAIHDTRQRFSDSDSRLIFVNAWNRWLDGAYLEPDARHGYAYLQACRDALDEETRRECAEPSILVVTHDCHPHGAQFLILEVVKLLAANGLRVRIVALDGGPLFDDFGRIGTTVNAKVLGGPGLQDFLARCRAEGTIDAITSTVVSGALLERLKGCGFRVLSLVHELPGVIRDMRQEVNAEAIARLADTVVFPATMVYERFNEIAAVPEERVLIRPQGVLRKNPYKGRAADARREVLNKHGLGADSRIVLGVGYVDSRKGADLFVEVAARVIETHPHVVFIWVGHAGGVYEAVQARIQELGLGTRILFIGFDREPMAYYAAASVYALPSREDPFPNVVLESAEVGVPVVAFEGACGAGDFILEHGGRLARHLDVEDFARRTCELLDGCAPGDSATAHEPTVGTLQQYVLDLLHRLNGLQRVSVVVPNYNYAHHIRGRLDSIVQQRLPIYEVLVLDDASNDGSAKIIEQYFRAAPAGSRLAALDARLIVNERNSGSAFRQWKRGVEKCRGDLVWIAEADDVAESDFLAELAPPFRDSDVVLAFCQSKQIDARGKVLAPSYSEYTKGVSNRWLLGYVRDGHTEIREALAIKNTIPNASAVVFRACALKHALDTLGERLFDYRVAGDWLIYVQVLLQGKVSYSERSLNRHRRHATSVTGALRAAQHLREVARVQQVVDSLTHPPTEVRAKAAAYLDELREHFRLGPDTLLDPASSAEDAQRPGSL